MKIALLRKGRAGSARIRAAAHFHVIFQNLLEIHNIYDIMCIKMLEEVQK
jgi:hypothetical protein